MSFGGNYPIQKSGFYLNILEVFKRRLNNMQWTILLCNCDYVIVHTCIISM